jgi:acyl dehydratase
MTVPEPSAPAALELIARNTAPDSDNKIHDDAEARRYGYAGGLVPGVTLYAYLTRLAVETFGAAWLERGRAECGFRRPVYEGERVRCEGEIVDGAALDLRVLRDGVVCAQGRAASGEGREPSGATVPLGGPVSEPLPDLSPGHVPIGVPLAPLHSVLTVEDAARYADDTDDPNPWYRGDSPFGGPLVPPGWLAARQAPLIRHNFRFGPSIHVRSVIRHCAPAFAGRAYLTAGVIRDTYERNGNHYLVMDAETRDDQDRIVYRVEHTTVFSVRTTAAG